MNRTFISRLLRLSNNWYKTGNVPIIGHRLLSRVPQVGAKITCAVGIATLALPVAHCWGPFGSKQESATKSEGKDMDDSKIVAEADALYKSGEGEKLYALLLAYDDSHNANILWRLARATCDLAKESKDQNRRAELMNEAFDYVSRALTADPNNYACHKWYGILLNYTSEIKGTKETIVNSFVVKEHFQKAIELNPKDATSIYLLGVWCFSLADLPWYQRKIASAIFASPPKTSYEEALGYFLQAEEADANFYSMNLLMIGKTYVRMGQKDKAIPYLQRARDFVAKTPDDKQANTEAVELLKSIGAA